MADNPKPQWERPVHGLRGLAESGRLARWITANQPCGFQLLCRRLSGQPVRQNTKESSPAHTWFGLGTMLFASIVWGNSALAQELAPRAYWPAPNGTNVIVVGYQHSAGDVIADPSLPLEGVKSDIDFAQVSYQRTLGLFGRTTNLQINLPYTWGLTEGLVEGEFRSRRVSAVADARFRFSVNLRGAPAMDGARFQELRAKPRTIVGASLLVQAPTGGYDTDRLINAGPNRWATKPAIGVIWPMRPTWLLEFELGAWFFGDNDNFLGETRRQDPILSSELHLVKRIRPGFWASLDLNYYVGGRTTVDGAERDDRQENSRIGVTLVFPFKKWHAIRVAYNTGISTKSGGDFDNFSLNYIYAWR